MTSSPLATPEELPESDSRRRFTVRVADYVRFRPRYSQALLQSLIDEAGLRPDWSIADIGSGTGFSSELFLRHGCSVTGVEPNADMRTAGDEYLAAYPNFRSVEGTAETTSLPDDSVEMVTAGQSLHWFNLPLARDEFNRILKPGGILAFFWNTRDEVGSPLMQELAETMARYTSREGTSRHQEITQAQRMSLFEGGECAFRTFAWTEPLTQDEMVGRTISSSYMPRRGDPAGDALAAELADIFSRYAEHGKVVFDYVTELYFGTVARSEV